jgi:ATP-binding cassette subfamily B protein
MRAAGLVYGAQVDEYDEYLVGYQQASVATESVAAVLNAGQGLVLAGGLTAVLAAATYSSPLGSFTAGDLVCAGRPSLPDAIQ